MMDVTGRLSIVIVYCVLCLAGRAPSLAGQKASARDALEALRAAEFDRAQQKAAGVLSRDRDNPYAHLIVAISRFRALMHQLATDLPKLFANGLLRGFNQRYLELTFDQADKELAQVDADLAAAARFPAITLDLCIACWRVDWNRDGRIDARDEQILEIELDAKGKPLPKGDPRRRPTFRFDYGDVLWARAFVSFQRALGDLLLAYDFSNIGAQLVTRGENGNLVIRLAQPKRVADARARILAGLNLADEARRAYLAETDDEREWLPNPRQTSHPLPLPVDTALFETWELVVGDLRRLVSSEEGLSVAEVVQLGGRKYDNPPRGFIDIGAMLSRPRDITIDLRKIEKANGDRPEELLQNVFGDYYVQHMKATPLLTRMRRMKREVERGEESIERKLRYLLWFN